MSNQQSQHIPVLLQETLSGLALTSNVTIIDGTLGGGGHAAEILKRIAPRGIVIGFDRDAETLETTTRRLQTEFPDRFIGIHDSYASLGAYAEMLDQQRPITGILADLGYSSFQIDDPSRGFSFQGNGPLDMRFDQTTGNTAADLLNTADAPALQRIFSEYGEYKQARTLAQNIVEQRQEMPFATVSDLSELVLSTTPAKIRRTSRTHPATTVFQALRIAVNDEFGHITRFIPEAMEQLAVGGRLAIITFHSLEDRIVKYAFRDMTIDCVCPPEFLECRCDKMATGKLVTRKPIIPTDAEIEMNPRARSAKLRIIEKITPTKNA